MYRKTVVAIVAATWVCVLSARAQDGAEYARIVPEGSEVVQLATGFNFVEGPAVDGSRILYFTDVNNGRIHTLDGEGTVSIFRTDRAARANGLMFDAQGRLYACEGGHGKVTQTEVDGTITVLAAEFEGERFNSPNDLVVAPDGGVYFTDPFWGSNQPQPVKGVYRIGPDGEVSLVVGDLFRPNGIMMTPDGATVYVANDGGGGIWRFDVEADGDLANGRQFAAMEGIVDGMTLDEEGNLYAAGGEQGVSQGVWIFASSGDLIGVLPVVEMPTNCTFGGQRLYITAGTSVYAIDLNVAGAYGERATAVRLVGWGALKLERR